MKKRNFFSRVIFKCQCLFFRARYRHYFKALCRKHPDACVVHVFGGAIGDCCISLAYLEAYRKQIGKPILLVASETLRELIPCFDGYDTVLYEPKLRIHHMGNALSSRSRWRWHEKHRDRLILPNPWPYLNPHVIKLREFNCLNLMRDAVFELREPCPYQVPKIPAPAAEILRLRAKKKVIVNPFSNSMRIDLSVFPKLIEYFRAAGYAVYTNCIDETSFCFPNTERLVLNLFDLYGACAADDYLLSVRSGICDFLAPTGIKQIVFFTQESYKHLYSLSMWGVAHLLELDGADPDYVAKASAFAARTA